MEVQISHLTETMSSWMARGSLPMTGGLAELSNAEMDSFTSSEKPVRQMICYNCGGTGHYRQTCIKPPRPKTGHSHEITDGPCEGAN